MNDASGVSNLEQTRGIAHSGLMDTYRTLSWRELLARLASAPKRDETAWQEVCRRLELFAKVVLPQQTATDPDLVGDIVSRVVVKIHQSPPLLDKLRTPSSIADPQKYLLSMAYHAGMDCLRAARSARRHGVSLDSSHDVPAHQPTPLEDASRRESAEELRAILEAVLEPAEWQLLRWRFWEDRSLAEIAQILDVPYHTSAMRLSRLHTKLREILQIRPSDG